MSKHRSQEDIIADILSIVVKGPKKTHIMYGANLSYSLLCKYLNKLVEAELITYRKKEKIYKLTQRGESYLDTYVAYKENESALNTKKARLIEILEPESI